MNKEKPVELAEEPVMELFDPIEIDLPPQELIPPMDKAVPSAPPEETKLISDEKLVGTYDEVLNNIRSDRSELDDLICQMKDMVLNGGDATTASKEALVNLMKIKLDTADKMSKIADLMTRARGTNTFPRYLAATQNNTINMEAPKRGNLTPREKLDLIEAEGKKNKEII